MTEIEILQTLLAGLTYGTFFGIVLSLLRFLGSH